MPWRRPGPDGSFDPYKILVSELMLQQTQVSRVTPKYQQFLGLFPDARTLAASPLADVLVAWSGLGYNRRAKFLWQAARMVVNEFGGVFPGTQQELVKLPGVGPNTAGAIMAYAYNQPVVFVETNIRTVLIHHFFQDQTGITDTQIREVMEHILQELPTGGRLTPREFYWAMMDYGAFLKKSVGNLNRDSKSYAKQSTFEGSRRQLRGLIIRLLATRPYSLPELEAAAKDERFASVLADLLSEQLVVQTKGTVTLA